MFHCDLAQGDAQQGREEQKHHPVHGLSLCHDSPQQQLPHQIRTMTHDILHFILLLNNHPNPQHLITINHSPTQCRQVSPSPVSIDIDCFEHYNICSDFMHISILIAILVVSGSATMKIQSPPELAAFFQVKYPDGSIPYSIANYGNVPYGKTISGQIGLPSVLEDCVLEELPDEYSNKKILLVERNDCTFTQKSINVQKEGGKLAIIMDNRFEDPNQVIMIDDGRGPQVSIPTVLISLEDGQQIMDALRKSSVIVVVNFEVPIRQKADLQIWIDIAQHQNFVFLRNLRPYYNKIKSHVDFSVAYPTKSCLSTACQETDCFYNQSYCRTDFKYWGVENKGQLIIKEQLRQYYIFSTSIDKWWDYVLAYDQLCDDLAVVEDCSNKLMKKYAINSEQINRMVTNSFGKDDNAVLQKFSELKYTNSILYFPSVIVNNMVYRGNLEPFEVHELICQSLQEQPEGCQGFKPSTSKSLSTWIIFVVAIVFIFGVFLVLCFRRVARRQVSEKINSQVNELVNQYITMYENQRFNQGQQLPTRKSNL